MSLARGAALAGIAAAVLASLTFGAAMPASAADSITPLFPSATNAADYALTVRGMDIYAAQSDAARAAWGPQMARVAAKDANIYRAAQVYGALDPEQLAEVIPMNGAVDQALNGKLTKGMLATNGPKGWVGKGFRFPSFSAGSWTGVRAAGGFIALTAAMYAWDHRADIAKGVVSWIGQDATGAVCSDPVAGGSNPINWITGQDCDQWRAGQAFVANHDSITAGSSSAHQCLTDRPSICVWITGTDSYTNTGAAYSSYWGPDGYVMPLTCFSTTGGGQYPSYIMTADGKTRDLGSYNGGGWAPGGTYGCSLADDSERNMRWSGNNTDPYSPMTGFQMEPGGPVTPVVQQASDPERIIRCTQYGSSGNVTNGDTAKFRQSSLVGGAAAPVPVCVPLPNGENQIRMVISQIDETGTTVLSDKSETAASADFRDKYSASCGTGSTQHTCLLDVVQIGNGISCFSATATCTDWFHDPARDSKYQCQFGGKNEPVQQCAILANTFDPAKRAAGNPYADPLTGDDTFSGTGSDADTMTMGNPAGSVIQPNGEVASCYGGNSPGAFNPISWIVRGGQCLLNWAFVPRPLVVQSRMAVVSSGWESNGIGKLVTAVNGWHISPVVAGCSSNLAFPVPMIHRTITVPVIQACPGTPMGDFAPWVRGLVSAGLIVTAGFAVKRIVSGWLPS